MCYIKAAVREPDGEFYPRALADSVHLFYSRDGADWEPLNQHYGILFAKAAVRQDNTLEPRSLRSPALFPLADGYGITAECVDRQGNPVGEGKVLLWTTKDFLTFQEHGLTDKRPEAGAAVLELPDETGDRLYAAWTPVRAVSVRCPEEWEAASWEEVEQAEAEVLYSDGSADRKRVRWDRASAAREGEAWRVRGTVERPAYPFPLAEGYADPVVFRWDGAWYFAATDDNRDAVGIRVRKAQSVAGLFAPGAEEHCILDRDEEKGFIQLFWAPEFHVIGGDVYLLFTVSGREWSPQSHMMRLKKGGSILRREDWEEPVRVRRRDGTPLTEKGITLDMTYFRARGKSYLVWSYRSGIGTLEDTGSMLYIAAADERTPWVLASDPVLLSRPLYAWENQGGTINNEGPHALVLDDSRIYLAYSGGAAYGWSYAAGFLMAKAEDDLLDAGNWTKTPTPVMSHYSVEGIYGPGHNSFFRDEAGKLYVAHHACRRDGRGGRCTAIRRVHLNAEGFPVMNLNAERDLPEEMRAVSMRVRFAGDWKAD